MTNDTFVGQQLLDSSTGKSSDSFDLKTVKGFSKVLALFQDRDPTEARLKSLKANLLEQLPIVLNRHAPFLVVILLVERTALAPPTSFDRFLI